MYRVLRVAQIELVIEMTAESFISPVPRKNRPFVAVLCVGDLESHGVGWMDFAPAIVLAIDAENPVDNSVPHRSAGMHVFLDLRVVVRLGSLLCQPGELLPPTCPEAAIKFSRVKFHFHV